MDRMTVDCIGIGPLDTNCWIVTTAGACWLFDVGTDPEPLLAKLQADGVTPTGICITHGHGDHIGGVDAIKDAYPQALVICPATDADMLGDANLNLSAAFLMNTTAQAPDQQVRPGDTLSMGPWTWTVLDTSGHTAGGVSYYCAEAGIAIVGDALFAGSIGRSDIPGGDGARLIANIRDHLLCLPDDTRVLPGHGPETDIGTERQTNPFLHA